MMLEVRSVSTGYDAVNVLKDVNVTAPPGELTVILGANGSGKSTLFRTISGLLRPRTGSISFDGRDLSRSSPNAIVKMGIAQAPEGRHLFPRMSVEKNLRLGAYTKHRDKARTQRNLQRVFDLFPILADKRHDTAGSLSGGQQQMVSIGRALMADPELLVLDEPSVGLAPLVTQEVMGAVQQVNATGIAVLLAEQNARLALRIAHHAYVLSEGRVVQHGSAAELMRNADIQRAYLGV
jgi:branched-chain amino acid transport system ATP-binding protein